MLTDKTKCICCQTNPINNTWSKSFCSRTCEHIWWRTDLQFTPIESLQRIALARLALAKPESNR